MAHWGIRWLIRRGVGDMRWLISQNSNSEARPDHCVTLFNFNFRIEKTISPMVKKVPKFGIYIRISGFPATFKNRFISADFE